LDPAALTPFSSGSGDVASEMSAAVSSIGSTMRDSFPRWRVNNAEVNTLARFNAEKRLKIADPSMRDTP
jgi:hypothetical protein